MNLFVSSALIVLAAIGTAPASPVETSIDIGSAGDGYRLAYGWNDRNERAGEETFRWILGKEGDLEVELPDAGPLELEIRARPFYYGNCRQSFALFVNERYVDEWVCRHDRSWTFHPYCTHVPADYLRPGSNTFTFRMDYESQHQPRGYSLAVDRISLRRGTGDAGRPWLPSAAVGGGLGVAILFLVFRMVRRM